MACGYCSLIYHDVHCLVHLLIDRWRAGLDTYLAHLLAASCCMNLQLQLVNIFAKHLNHSIIPSLALSPCVSLTPFLARSLIPSLPLTLVILQVLAHMDPNSDSEVNAAESLALCCCVDCAGLCACYVQLLNVLCGARRCSYSRELESHLLI